MTEEYQDPENEILVIPGTVQNIEKIV